VIVRFAIEDVASRGVFDLYQWVVGGGLIIIAVHCALREAVELCTSDEIVAVTNRQAGTYGIDGRLPRGLISAGGHIDLYIG
jgi:hypothetical protein